MADTNTWVLNLSTDPPDIYNSAISEHNHNAFEPPYPLIFWQLNQSQDDITHSGETTCEILGAFANATKLKRVSIPRSVKYIGANAFTNTQLRSVTIASDCTYFDTSFPEGCVVNFYPD